VRASCTVPSLATFYCTLCLPLRTLWFPTSQKSGLSLINNQRYDFSPLIALYFLISRIDNCLGLFKLPRLGFLLHLFFVPLFFWVFFERRVFLPF